MTAGPPKLIPRLCGWAAQLGWDDIPRRTQRLARAQLLGWLGSLAAGHLADESAGLLRVAAGLGRDEGLEVWPGGGVSLGKLGAAYASAALSCAHDYDDYLFLAHTSHSACGVPWVWSQHLGRPLREVLTAQVAANELMGRLGAACLVGPQNGQLWTFVHLAGAVIGAGRLEGRSGGDLAGALSLAFFQPPMALWTGFGAASSKLLSAATPTLVGLLALEHQAQGMAGAADALEGPGGFLDRFSYLPLTDVFEDLGRRWLTDSLSVKPVPGCAYVTAPVQAALECAERFARAKGRPLRPADVKRVVVCAGPMTVGMERLLGGRADRSPLSPVAVNFSVPFSVGLALTRGRLDPEDLAAGPLRALEPTLRQVAGRVTLDLDPALSEALIESVGLDSGLWAALRRRGAAPLLRGVAAALRATPGDGHTDVSARSVARGLGRAGKALWRGRASSATASAPRFPFGAHVALETSDGNVFEAGFKVPDGAAGSGDERVARVALEKLVRETGRYAEIDRVQSLGEAALAGHLDDSSASEIAARLSGHRAGHRSFPNATSKE